MNIFYRLQSDDFETIETAIYIPQRTICVFPKVPLQVKTAFFTTASSVEGCINYGGGSSILLHRVQAKGYKGQVIEIHQLLTVEGE